MATATLSPTPVFKAFDNNGIPLTGGKLFTYSAGTTTKAPTYTDSTQVTQNANPVILNSRGEANVWVPPNTAFKFVLSPSTDTDPPSNPIWTVDQIVNAQLITLYGGVDTGAVNAYILTFTANFTSLANGIVIYWVPANTNTGSSTVNVNSSGAINLVNPDGSSLIAGQVTSGQPIQMMYYNGNWILLNGTFIPGSLKVGGNLTLTGNATITGTVSASVSADNAARGIGIVRFKSTGTARSSNVTISLDPDLQFALSGGSWQFEALLLFNGTTTGTQGISLSLKAGGSGPASVNPNTLAQGFVNGAASAASSSGWVVGTAPGWSYATISTSGNDAVMVSGTLIGATAGTYGIGWSQGTTSVNATNMLAGSWMRMVRMA